MLLSRYDITKHDVDKFLSESNRHLISKRLLISTTDGVGSNAVKVCDAQDKPVVRFLLSDFEKSNVEYPSNFEQLSQSKRKAPPSPRDHQLEAIETVASGLKNSDRGQLIMACGTGKNFTTLWIKEKLNAQKVLVLVPSLSLLAQTLREWTFAAEQPFDVLCICSDQSVGKRESDEIVTSVGEVPFPVTSSLDEIKHFLKSELPQVVFCTYQSSTLIEQAHLDLNIPSFDLAVADEAHRCTGKVGTDFTTVLNNSKIRSIKRLFTTATPRTYSSVIKKGSEDLGVEVVGMDDEEVFGPVVSLARIRSLDEAIEWINNSPFANTASLFTASGAAARQFSYEASPTMLGLNIGVPAPMSFFAFGGAKDSFFGDIKAHGTSGVQFFTDTKVTIQRWNKDSNIW